jgi:hypothetical protein
MKINIRDQLPKYLGEVKLLTTKCCILEAEKLGPSKYFVKVFAFKSCIGLNAFLRTLQTFRSLWCYHDLEAVSRS